MADRRCCLFIEEFCFDEKVERVFVDLAITLVGFIQSSLSPTESRSAFSRFVIAEKKMLEEITVS